MSIFDDIQKKIDSLGWIDREINSSSLNQFTAPIVGKDEYEWYNNQLYVGGDRRLRLVEYAEMNSYAEISSGLDIYADDGTQRNNEGKMVSVFSQDEDLTREIEELLYDRMAIDSIIWQIFRGACLNGDVFGELILQKDKKGVLFLKLLPTRTMWRIEENGKLRGFVQELPNSAPVHFAPFEMVHFRLPSVNHSFNPYGTSIIEPARRPWRQLRLMEDAMVVYRITRAPERRVFNIDVGNLPTSEAQRFVENHRLKLRKKSFIDRNGNFDWKANTMAPDEDFWFPKRAGSEGTTVDTLPGAQQLGEIDDVKYFKDKIFAAMKVPRIFLQDTEGIDEKRQNVSQQDIAFARTVERIQSHILEGLKKIVMVHLMLRGYKKSKLDDFELSLTPPSNLSEKTELELLTERSSVADSLVQFGFSREHVAENIFKMPKSEWEDIKKIRFKEKIIETKVEQGEWNENEDQNGMIEFGSDEQSPEENPLLTFEHFYNKRKNPLANRLLFEGEFEGLAKDGKADTKYLPKNKKYINEKFEEILKKMEQSE